MKEWRDFNKFESIVDKYMTVYGEGDTKASQAVTAMNKLIYKWYNDGDVFDNSYALEGWCNDLSDEANWLYDRYGCDMLENICECTSDSDYEDLLWECAEYVFNETMLEQMQKYPLDGSIYECDGPFKFVDRLDEEW